MCSLKVAAIQMSSVLGEVEHNREKAEHLVEQAAQKGSSLIVLPELCLTGFFPSSKTTSVFKLAEKIDDGLSVQRFKHICKKHKINLVLPIFESSIPGVYYNSSVIIDSQGEIVGVYRKTHIPMTESYEKYYFKPGNKLEPFNLSFARMGILICYDRHYGEAWQCLVMQGATIIVTPTASWRKGEKSELFIWEDELKVRACDNAVYVIMANATGKFGELDFIGHSMIVDPHGRVLEKAEEQEDIVVCAEIDLNEVEKRRQEFPLLRDRRDDLYNSF